MRGIAIGARSGASRRINSFSFQEKELRRFLIALTVNITVIGKKVTPMTKEPHMGLPALMKFTPFRMSEKTSKRNKPRSGQIARMRLKTG